MKKTYRIAGHEITVNQSLVDKAISYINPVAGAKRLQARAQMAAFEAIGGGYNTSRSRPTMFGWQTKALDADSAILPDLPELRDNCNDLVRKNPLAVGAINTCCTSIVGTGLKLQAQIDRDVLDLTEEEADAWERKAEREFRLWAESKDNCDIERKQNFSELQALTLRSMLENGDVFVVLPYRERPGCPYGLKIQLVEAARVSNPMGRKDDDTIAAGVEKNPETGESIAYHVSKYHPGNTIFLKTQNWNKVEAFSESGRRNILHIFKQIRIGQTRGLPFLAPVIEAFKQLGRYTEAELAAAVVAACFTVFVKTKTGEGAINTIVSDVQGGGQPQASGAGNAQKLVEGGVVALASGEEIQTASPGRPNDSFDPFITAITRQIGVALEIPYEVLVKHFLSSYSAARAALLEAWKFFLGWRQRLADNLCQPIYEVFIDEAVALGRLSAPGYFEDPVIRKAYLGSVWVGPSRGMLDETKEVDAAVTRISEGITTLSEETPALTGTDWEKKIPQMRKERAVLKELGLPLRNTGGGLPTQGAQNEQPIANPNG